VVYRRYRSKPSHIPQESALLGSGALLGLLILGLSFTTAFDPAFAWFAGVYTLVLSAVALVWYRLLARWGSTRQLFASLDWTPRSSSSASSSWWAASAIPAGWTGCPA
jgi:hypothetical protein